MTADTPTDPPTGQPAVDDDQRCPCGRGPRYGRCCGRLHRGEAEALTAEDLMRSRYSAFAVGDVAYLERSWHPTTRPKAVRLVPDQRWTGLDIVAAQAGGPLDAEGVVEFIARYERSGRADALHERSTFTRVDGRWVYVSGQV